MLKSDNINTITEIHTSLQIIKPSAWLYVFCILCFLLGFCVWACWVKIEMTVPSIGIILTASEFNQAENLWQESINEHQEKLTTLENLFMQQKQLYTKRYITITELEKAREDYLLAKEELATIKKQNAIFIYRPLFTALPLHKNEPLDVLMFVSHLQGKKIKTGMDSYVLPDTVSAFKYGYIRGKVMSVSEYPVTKDAVNAYLGNMGLVDEFFNNSVPFMVRVRLTPDSTTYTGLNWTSGKGAQFTVEPGTTVTGKIVVKTVSPLELVIS